jgi:quercetin 2,3-dioxygenase
MITRRPAAERGHARFDWLDSRHSFSFGNYHDDRYMGFGPLRVINEDVVAPGSGFGTHGHRDMEIVTYVLEGALEHKDSLGTGEVIRPGEVQRMTAGTGIQHSEFNPSPDAPVHLLQVWLLPERNGMAPGYEQREFPLGEKDRLHLVASRDGREGSLTIHQDVDLLAGRLSSGAVVERRLRAGRLGRARLGDESLVVERFGIFFVGLRWHRTSHPGIPRRGRYYLRSKVALCL